MEISKQATDKQSGYKFIFKDGDKEVAYAFLYLLYNEQHEAPFGFIEDVYVNEDYRGHMLGTRIVEAMIEEARAKGCYKLICTARNSKENVQAWYQKMGFEDWGKEFRMDL